MAKRILLTGYSGFVGQHLVRHLNSYYKLRLLGRSPCKYGTVFKYDLNTSGVYLEALESVDVLIHCAARVHKMNDSENSSLNDYSEQNSTATIALAKQAAEAGVSRFIFLSTIKVNGETNVNQVPFFASDIPSPQDPYSVSKNEAEKKLVEIGKSAGMEIVIIRPPLIYGPGVKANFLTMLKVANKNLPLPLGAINNKRSLVGIDNLVDLIKTCVEHPNAANQTFLVSDDNDVSTTELLQMMTRAAGKKPMLLPIPINWLKFAGKIAGRKAEIDRLCGNLQVDITHTKEALDWRPPITIEEGLKRCFNGVDL